MDNLSKLLTELLGVTRREVAAWAGVSRPLVDFWRRGVYRPNPKARAKLVKAVRAHAARLLRLAEKVEAEGEARAAGARSRARRPGRGRRGVPAKVRRGAGERDAPRS